MPDLWPSSFMQDSQKLKNTQLHIGFIILVDLDPKIGEIAMVITVFFPINGLCHYD